MTSDSELQHEIADFLSRPGNLPGAATDVERVETHISIIFLAGDRAWKLKRARTFPYLDFSTLENRRKACDAEVSLNRRTAPDIYLGVVAVTRKPRGGFEVGGSGDPVDWMVEMRRFDQSTLFDKLATENRLDRPLMEELAEAIAEFHAKAEVYTDRGGRAGVQAVADSNAECFIRDGKGIFEDCLVADLDTRTRAAVDRVGDVLDKRRADGRVRHCHGDLHLRNIFLHDGRPTLFDAIEFSEDFSIIDVLYDLAFLLMDLDHRGHRRLANLAFNRYMAVTGDVGGLACLPLFLSLRAAVRAHVGAAAANTQSDKAQSALQADEARRYLEAALAYLDPLPPRAVAVGGLSGSGKSRLAREIAPYIGVAPGAFIARSDAIRKRLAGTSLSEKLDQSGYTPEMTQRTYETVYADMATALEAGHAAIADAVFAKPEQRTAVEAVARERHVPFDGIWLESDRSTMATRIDERQDRVSDATPSVLDRQLTYELGEISWHRVDSSGTREATLQAGLAVLGVNLSGTPPTGSDD